MSEQYEHFAVGTDVCIKGQGTDSFVHKHAVVERLTKTLIITDDGRRFRRDAGDFRNSVPYSAYGGTSVSRECQVKE